MFTETLQIGIVVRDLDEAMRLHVERYGIGPWSIFEMGPSNVDDMTKDGEPEQYAMRTAVTMVGSVQWELIQPIGSNTIYADHLARHGEGLHHVLVSTPGYDATIEAFRERGRATLMAGNYKGDIRYAYLPTEEDLKYVVEIFEPPAGHDVDGTLTPDAIYPAEAT
jgi:hypothetical protein